MNAFPDLREPDNDLTYWPLFTQFALTDNFLNQLLRAIAVDECRAFFISWHHGAIVAPYDGGVDVILRDESTRDYYKHKYRDWLSTHSSGL